MTIGNPAKSFAPLNSKTFQAIDTLKNVLISPSVLTLNPDACDVQIGYVLFQKKPDDATKLIVYWSHLLTNTELQYETTKRECLAIVCSVLLLQTYLEGQCFTIQTEHDALKWTLDLADSTGRLAPLRLRLSEFDLNVIHHAGIMHQATDALSRLSNIVKDESPLEDGLLHLTIDHVVNTNASGTSSSPAVTIIM